MQNRLNKDSDVLSTNSSGFIENKNVWKLRLGRKKFNLLAQNFLWSSYFGIRTSFNWYPFYLFKQFWLKGYLTGFQLTRSFLLIASRNSNSTYTLTQQLVPISHIKPSSISWYLKKKHNIKGGNILDTCAHNLIELHIYNKRIE